MGTDSKACRFWNGCPTGARCVNNGTPWRQGCADFNFVANCYRQRTGCAGRYAYNKSSVGQVRLRLSYEGHSQDATRQALMARFDGA